MSTSPVHPPVSPNDQGDIDDVEQHQPPRLDQCQFAIRQASDEYHDGEGKESNVPDERPSGDLERLDERHASDDNRDDEAGGSE